MIKTLTVTLVAALLSSCSFSDGAEPRQRGDLTGFRELTFGMSFDDAVAIIGAQNFNPVALKNCLLMRAVRGCFLSSRDNLSTYKTIDGVPYAAALSFNRHDKLTDISLEFVRETIDDPDEKISEADCLTMHERTLDWIARDFGVLDRPHLSDKVARPERKTGKGNPYWYSKDNQSGGFMADAEREMAGKRTVHVLSYYMPIGDERSCNVDAAFGDSPDIERWSLSPDERAESERITSSQ